MNDPSRKPMLRGVRLDDLARDMLRLMVEQDGVPAASSRLGISVSSLGRALGGLPVLRGTALVIEAGLGLRKDRD